jgi:hypothetical protein
VAERIEIRDVVTLVKNRIVVLSDLNGQVEAIKELNSVLDTNRFQERTVNLLKRSPVGAVCQKKMILIEMAVFEEGLKEIVVRHVSAHMVETVTWRQVIVQTGPDQLFQLSSEIPFV